MSQADTRLVIDKHPKGRFRWVKRLVQGQTQGQTHGQTRPIHTAVNREARNRENDNKSVSFDDNSTRKSIKSMDYGSDMDSGSSHSDNVSTVPLKLIVSRTSTTSPPSLLSGELHQDNSSYVASTAETSLAPSIHVSLLPSHQTGPSSLRESTRDLRERDRDSESIVTLASLSRRTRRRSIDTNCSMAGIPPASIMERLAVTPVSPGDDDV